MDSSFAPNRPSPGTLRLVAWNVRAGGGRRAERIASALLAMHADVLVLSEFRSGAASAELTTRLAQAGFRYRLSTLDEVPAGGNGLMIASLVPIRRVPLQHRPDEPGRWLMVRLARPRLAIGAMHAPNLQSGRKGRYQQAVADVARRWRGGAALLVGDTNSGRIGEDEETPVFDRASHVWFDTLRESGWFDGFRLRHGKRREFTWYSPQRGHGFRLDQVFLESRTASALLEVHHHWAIDPERPGRRDGLSDHAALIVDLDARRLAAGTDDTDAGIARHPHRAGEDDLFAGREPTDGAAS